MDDSAPQPAPAPATPAPNWFARLTANLPWWAYIAFFIVLALLFGGIFYVASLYLNPEPKDKPAYHTTEVGRVEDGFGWGSELLVDKKAGQPAKIRFMLRDKDRKPVANAETQITFFKPENPARQFSSPMGMEQPGVYRTALDLPEPGYWEVRIHVKVGKTAYQTVRHVNLP